MQTHDHAIDLIDLRNGRNIERIMMKLKTRVKNLQERKIESILE